MLCLDKDVYRGFIKLQADKNLGRAYAGLLPYVEGLYRMGYISKEVYDFHFKKYSEPMTKETVVPESEEEKQNKAMLKQKDKLFLEMIAQFEIHSESATWLSRCRNVAEPFKVQLESARNLLALIEKATVQSEATVQSIKKDGWPEPNP